MTWMICWLVIHTSNNNLDNRKYIQVKGYVMTEGTEINQVNFYNDMKKRGVNLNFNAPVQWVHDNECSYVKKP